MARSPKSVTSAPRILTLEETRALIALPDRERGAAIEEICPKRALRKVVELRVPMTLFAIVVAFLIGIAHSKGASVVVQVALYAGAIVSMLALLLLMFAIFVESYWTLFDICVKYRDAIRERYEAECEVMAARFRNATSAYLVSERLKYQVRLTTMSWIPVALAAVGAALMQFGVLTVAVVHAWFAHGEVAELVLCIFATYVWMWVMTAIRCAEMTYRLTPLIGDDGGRLPFPFNFGK